MKPTLVVLAAGMGSRYGGLKQLDRFGPSGECILDYSIYDAIRAGFGKVVFVIRKNIEDDFKKVIGDKFSDKIQVEYVFQELDNVPEGIKVPADRVKPWGTGHALLVAGEKVNEPFAVINADDFYGSKSYQIIADFLSQAKPEENNYCLVGYEVQNTLSEHGSVSRGVCSVNANGMMEGVTERTKIYKEGEQIVFEEDETKTELAPETLVSMNLIGYTPTAFKYYKQHFETFIKENIQNLKSELYIPFVLNDLVEDGTAKVKMLSTTEKWFGVTYPDDKEVVISRLNKLIKEGVYPNSLWG